jgi:hypothetical protein
MSRGGPTHPTGFLRGGVGGPKSIQLGWPARSLPKTTQSERHPTRHNPTLRAAAHHPNWTAFCPPTTNVDKLN